MWHGHARHGQSRPKTPTYQLWTKVRGRAKCCARWKRSSFEEFMGDIVAAIGNPSPRAWLCRVNPRRAWSRNNVAWMSPEEARARKCARKRGKKRRDYRHTPETRAKIGLANRGRRLSPEHLAKLIAANQGRRLSAEHRARIGARSARGMRGHARRMHREGLLRQQVQALALVGWPMRHQLQLGSARRSKDHRSRAC